MGYSIGYLIGAAVVIYALYMVIKNHNKYRRPLPLPPNYKLIDSPNQWSELSSEVLVLLVTDNVTTFLGLEDNNRKEFEVDILPDLNTVTKDINEPVTICWSNIKRRSELTEYLKGKGLMKNGCFLFKNGELLKYKLFGFMGNTKFNICWVAEEVLNDFSSEI